MKQTKILTHATHVNGWFPAVYMSCMSQNFRLFHLSNLSVRNFRIFLLMYPGSLTATRTSEVGRAARCLPRTAEHGQDYRVNNTGGGGRPGAVRHRPLAHAIGGIFDFPASLRLEEHLEKTRRLGRARSERGGTRDAGAAVAQEGRPYL